MAGHALEVRESVSKERGPYKKLHHMEIEPVKGANGGHIVTHHYQSEGMDYHKPQTHLFSKEEGSEMLAHVAKHLGVKAEATQEEHAEPENDQEAASEPAEENVEA